MSDIDVIVRTNSMFQPDTTGLDKRQARRARRRGRLTQGQRTRHSQAVMDEFKTSIAKVVDTYSVTVVTSNQPRRLTKGQVAESSEAVRQMDLAPEPKNLAEALKQGYDGFEDALRDPAQGHKAVADAFPFTSESSVRRWRKANDVEVSR